MAVLSLMGALTLVCLVWALLTTPSDTFVLLPDAAHPADGVVKIAGETRPAGDGGIYYLDVLVHRASLAESWLARFEDGATLVPAALLLPPGGTQHDQQRVAQVDVQSSKQVAAAVALRALGRPVRVTGGGVVAEAIEPRSPAARAGLAAGMVITALGHDRTRSLVELRRALDHHRPGDRVVLHVLDGRRARSLGTTLIAGTAGANKGHALIGILPGDAPPHVHLPIRVAIDTGDLGGPSAGLSFALEIYDSLTHGSLSRGRRVAVTGTIALDGSVGPVGGIRQKTLGARERQAALMLVPRANLAEARAAAGTMPVYPIDSFAQALRVLRRGSAAR